MNQEYQLQKLREILLDETLSDVERVTAQKSIMKILDLKEEETSEDIDIDDYDINKRRFKE